MWRLWLVEGSCRPAAGAQPGSAVESGEELPVRGAQLPAQAGMPDCDAVHKTDPVPGLLH